MASDAERNAVVQRLQTAHAQGRIDDLELGERLESALRARTRGDLAMLLTDLPADPTAAAVIPVPEPTLPARRADRGGALAAWSSWGVASSVTFVIWLIIFITTGAAYPWFLWVAGPWGAVLAVKTITGGFRDDG